MKRIGRRVTNAIDGIPIWVLRGGVVLGGLLAGAVAALLFYATDLDHAFPVDVDVLNASTDTATVQLDTHNAMQIASTEEITLTDGAEGDHRLEVVTNTEESLRIEMRFNADWPGTSFNVRIGGPAKSP